MSDQLAMLTDSGDPAVWPCPTCRGNRTMLRRLYPDEAEYYGVEERVEPCRTCHATGTVDYDPDDRTVFPF